MGRDSGGQLMAIKNIKIRKNATLELSVTYTDSAGVAVDLSSATAKLQIRNTKGGDKLYYTATDADDITITGASGLIVLTIPTDTTSTFGFSKGAYDLVVTFPNDTATVILEGKVTVDDGVTV